MNGLSAIYRPVYEELEGVKSIIKCHVMAMEEIKNDIEPYFNGEAKYMMPFHALISAKMVLNGGIDIPTMSKLFDFAVAIELIHTASLVHDGILDSELKLRGGLSLNIKYGDRRAVILGDMLYTRALKIINRSFNSNMAEPLLDIINKMCHRQLMGKAGGNGNRINYINMAKHKTGLLMGYSCTGVYHCCRNFTNQALIDRLFNFGVNAGIFYQMADDSMDKDTDFRPNEADMELVRSRALDEISIFPSSIYKEGLSGFFDSILQHKNITAPI